MPESPDAGSDAGPEAGREARRIASAWLAADPDPQTRDETRRLLEDEAPGSDAALRDRFATSLAFGTAGLRGPLGAGPNRMNRVVAARTAAGIARWLDACGHDGPVVVGTDARHLSTAMGADIVAVFRNAGRRVSTFAGPVPTPVAAFVGRRVGAATTVVVTASHNPASDNGIKVYGPDAVQITTPVDTEIAAAIDAIGPAEAVAAARESAPERHDPEGGVPDGGDHLDAYLDAVAALRCRPETASPRVAYSAMHGVGSDVLRAAFARTGLDAPVVVAAQDRPDPEFPTVAFPNPEEPGAMDLLVATARNNAADVALANDPDADRLAVAVPADVHPASARDRAWRVLSGDEIGAVLADHLLRHGSGPDRLVATTVVSSSLLAKLAAAHDVQFRETLTGFKWLARVDDERGPAMRHVLSYEEALGYRVGDVVRDKDGIGAAVAFVDAVAALAADGNSVPRRLAELAVEHGLHHTAQRSLRLDGPDALGRLATLVDSLRRRPPASLAGAAVREIEDLAEGVRLPPTNALILHTADERIVVRPSGTEPKLKIYLEVRRTVPAVADESDVRRAAAGRAAELAAAVAALLDEPR